MLTTFVLWYLTRQVSLLTLITPRYWNFIVMETSPLMVTPPIFDSQLSNFLPMFTFLGSVTFERAVVCFLKGL